MGENLIPSCIMSPFILHSFLFPFTFLHYVYVSSCTYAQNSQKQKTEDKEEKNEEFSANNVAETLSTGGKGKK